MAPPARLIRYASVYTENVRVSYYNMYILRIMATRAKTSEHCVSQWMGWIFYISFDGNCVSFFLRARDGTRDRCVINFKLIGTSIRKYYVFLLGMFNSGSWKSKLKYVPFISVASRYKTPIYRIERSILPQKKNQNPLVKPHRATHPSDIIHSNTRRSSRASVQPSYIIQTH